MVRVHDARDAENPGHDPEGCVTCPLHRLRWNLRTGELARAGQVKSLMEAVSLT